MSLTFDVQKIMQRSMKFEEEIFVNKSELINALADKAKISKKDAEKAVGAFVVTVTELLT